MVFSSSEEKVLNKLGDPQDYYLKHYTKNKTSKFYLVCLILRMIFVIFGGVFLNVVINHQELFDHFIKTAFGVSSGPIYFGGMVLGIGLILIFSSIKNFLIKKK